MISKLLKEKRESLGMSLQDVVGELWSKFRIETSRQNISRYEIEGKVKQPDYELLHAIYEILGLDRSSLPKIEKRSPDNNNGTSEAIKKAEVNLERLKAENEALRLELEFWKSKYMKNIG